MFGENNYALMYLQKIILGLIALTFSYTIAAQQLYWIGGTGDWNNPNNWSDTPDGSPSDQIPNQFIDAVFTSSSFEAENEFVYFSDDISCNNISFLEINTRHTLVSEQEITMNIHGNVQFSDSTFVNYSGTTNFHTAGVSTLNLESKVFASDMAFLGAGTFFLESHLLLDESNLIIDCAAFQTAGNSIVCNGLSMPASYPTEIDVRDSKVFIEEFLLVDDAVRVFQNTDNVLINEDILEENLLPGEFTYTPSANRTNTCGNGVGQTPFTINAMVISDYNGEDVSCNGVCDGEAFVDITGGVGPFLFQWIGGGGAFTQNFPDLCVGTYTVLVTDQGQGIVCVDNVQLTEPPPITVFDFMYSPPSCDGLCDGIGTPIVIGGVPGYDFIWSTGETSQTATQLCEGINTLSFTDQNGCPFDTTFTVELFPIYANIDITNIICAGENSGSAISNPSGGDDGPYDFVWSTGDLDNDITNQSAGFYDLTVTDGSGCSIDTTFEITEEPPMIITLDDLQDVSCGGLADGSIEISVTGGLANYNFDWTGPNGYTSSVEDIFDLEEGQYNLTMTDQNMCEQIMSFDITAPDELTLDFSVTPILCFGDDNAAIDMTINGGLPGYIIAWTGPNGFISSDEDISNLEPGTYDVIVSDINFCMVIGSVEITEPDELDAQADVTPITCNGADDGAIDITPNGGTPGYTVSWTGPNGFTSSDEDIADLEAGDYDLALTDANDCQLNITITIDDTPAIDVVADITNISCGGDDNGSIELSISGGTPGYTTDWTGPNGFISSDEDIFDLEPGAYDLVVTDQNNCQLMFTYNVDSPAEMTLDFDSTDILCFGDGNGAIDMTITGGTNPFTISWTGPDGYTSSDEDISSLEAGTYDVVVEDDNACIAIGSVEILESPEIIIDSTITPISCNGSNGAIDLEITGGLPPYQTDWTGPNGYTSSDEDISGLEPGDYDLILTDSNNCVLNLSFTLDDTPPIDVQTDVVDVTCPGDADGSITLSISGGIAPYTVLWETGDTTLVLSGLAGGEYDVTVTDDAGCFIDVNDIQVQEPEAIDILSVITPILCFGDSAGAIAITVSGGTPDYNFTWVGPNGFTSNAEDISDLFAGIYDLEITDANDCNATFQMEVLEEDEITVDADITLSACTENSGAIDITISGGLPPYLVGWLGPNGFTSLDEDISDLEPGDYELSILDANFCVFQTVYVIDPLDLIQVDETITNLDCSGLDNGSIEIDISGGNPAYIISWTGPNGFTSSDEDIFDLAEGTYNLNVEDSDGCFVDFSYEITQPELIDVVADLNPPMCAGQNTGAIDITVSGGVPDFTFSWTGPDSFTSSSEDISNLDPGTYTLHIDDDGGCVFDATYELDENSGINIEVDSEDIGCLGEDNGTIDITVTGGLEPYQFAWTGPGGFNSSDEDLSDLSAGDYDLTLTDANLCVEQISVSIEEGQEVIITPQTNNSTCGSDDGSAWVNVQGGVDPITINWQDDALTLIGTDSLITDLAPGLYYLTVFDANNCGDVIEINISDSNVADLDTDITEPSCYGMTNGTIDLTVSNGTEPYSFDWTGPDGYTSIDEDIADLETGNYTVVVSDSLGCVITETYTLNQPDSIILSADVLDIFCNGGNTGAIDLSIFGGTPDFDVSWTGPDSFTSSDEDLTDLAPGDYEVVVTDANLCSASATFTIIESDELGIDADMTDVLCFGENNGQIDVTIFGGTLPYDFSWTGPNGFISSNEDIMDLSPGDYTILVVDGNDCSIEVTYTIDENPEIELAIDITQPNCQMANGSLTATASGGNGAGYFYFWYDVDNGNMLIDTTATISGLSAGVYYIEVFDNLGCSTAMDIALSDVEGSIDSDVQDVLCYGGNTGTIDITVSGAFPPYDYEWTGPNSYSSFDEDIVDLEAGDYTVMVTDSLGCFFAEIIPVNQADSISISFTSGNILCNGDNNGVILTSVSGGTPDYAYSWTGPDGFSSSSGNLSDLGPGCYTLEVTDANLCVALGEACIEEPDSLEVLEFITHVECFGDSTGSIEIDISGGMPFYSVTWIGPNSFSSNDEDIYSLYAGAYDLQMVDQNGCIYTNTFIVNQNNEILVEVNPTMPLCYGDSNGTIDLTISGGSGELTTEWSGDIEITAEDISDLAAGTYNYFVYDEMGCNVLGTVELENPDSLNVLPTITNISCNGETDGSILIDIEGGLDPYSTFWTGPNGFSTTAEDIIDLEAGTYELSLGDLNLCSSVFTFEITEPDSLVAEIFDTGMPNCSNTADGFIEIDIIGGTPDYDIAWTGPDGYTSTDEDIEDLLPGSYSLMVQDSMGCTFSINEVLLTPLIEVEAIAPDDFEDCYGNGPWTFSGTNNGGDEEAWYDDEGTLLTLGSNLEIDPEPGIYTYVYQITDDPCVDTDTLVVTIWELPDVDAGEDQFIFYEESTEIGGDPTTEQGNLVTWSPIDLLLDSTLFNPTTIELIEMAEFIVIAMDENGCTASDTILVNIIPEVDIPSGFTPNEDGTNDLWELGNVAFYPNTIVEVYNRWGDQLYYSEGYDNPWDGTYNGKPLPIGTYYFVINVNEPEFPEPLTGPVTIMR